MARTNIYFLKEFWSWDCLASIDKKNLGSLIVGNNGHDSL